MKKERRTGVLLVTGVAIISVVLCFAAVGNMGCRKNTDAGTENIGWDAKKQLDFAETLASKGLKKEALTAFDDYLKIAKISAIEAGKLFYRMGNIYLELLDYDKALYYFYKAEAFYPKADFKTALDQKLVECLENMGMTQQAQYELSQRASPGAAPLPAPTGVVVAKVGDYQITEAQINDAINAMPDWAKESFSQGEGKVEFVRQYATTQALYEKAKRLGLEDDADVRRNIRDITKKLLVQKFLETQLKDKINISPSDVETFYEANKDRFTQPAAASLSVIKISDEKKAQEAFRKFNVGADFAKMASEISEDEPTKAKGGLIETDVEKDVDIPGIGFSQEANNDIFSKKGNDISGPFKIRDAYYIFRINKMNPQKQLSFEEVRDQAEYMYREKKTQEYMQVFLKNVLQEQQVEVYADKILGDEKHTDSDVRRDNGN